MKIKSLLSEENIAQLESWSDGYFYKIFYFLEDFVENGVKNKLFTLKEAKEDVNIALWYAYAGNNIDVYEYYYKVINWLPYSEKNAKGIGAWYYRYSVALIYCGNLDKAYIYAKKGVEEEPKYPWGWLNLAKLQYYFGQTEEALISIEKGLNIVKDDYEFTTLKQEIMNGCSFEDLLCHYINSEDDKFLQQQKELQDEFKQKMEAINGVICNQEALMKLKNIINGNVWQEDCPYCNCRVNFADKDVIFTFKMNRAMLSKIDLEWFIKEYKDIKERLINYSKYNIVYTLQAVEISRDYEIKLYYYNKELDMSLVEYKVGQELKQHLNKIQNHNKQIEDIALTLYKQDEHFSYVECWLEDDKIIKHYGQVGKRGDIKVYENCSVEDYKLYLDIFVGRYEKLGYISWRECVKKTLLIKIQLEEAMRVFPDDISMGPIYLIYEMLQKSLEINVVGFLNDWGYRKNVEQNVYEIDFYFDTVDKDIAIDLVKQVVNSIIIEDKMIIKEIAELSYR